jgi:hypothetical protein
MKEVNSRRRLRRHLGSAFRSSIPEPKFPGGRTVRGIGGAIISGHISDFAAVERGGMEMHAPRRIENEIVLALYRYSLLTTDQLSTLLHYERKTIYKAFYTLKGKGWVQSLPLPFAERNVKGWVLSKSGMEVALGITKEHRPRLLKQTGALSGQTAHLYRSNRFFTDLIACSLACHASEGLVDWVGMRDSGDRYPITTPTGKRTTPLRPDGIGTYRFENTSEVIVHVEYDTGSEHLWVIHGKLWAYADALKTFWSDESLANVLFVTQDARRSKRILELWKDMKEDAFRRQPTPSVWTTTENLLDEQGIFGSVWRSVEDTAVSFLDFPRLNGGNSPRTVPLGKQIRARPFPR